MPTNMIYPTYNEAAYKALGLSLPQVAVATQALRNSMRAVELQAADLDGKNATILRQVDAEAQQELANSAARQIHEVLTLHLPELQAAMAGAAQLIEALAPQLAAIAATPEPES